MHAFLYRVGWFCARRHWIVIGAWIVILAALLLLRNAFGGTYTNNYTVPGSNSQQGTDLLEKEFPNQSMYSGQIVFASPKGKTVADQTDAVNTSVTNISKLPDILSATSPFASGNSSAVSKSGTVAYATVNFDVAPSTLDSAYLSKLDTAVKPARDAGLEVEYGGGAGQIGTATSDKKSEVIGLTAALILLFIMFISVVAALIPLVSATFSVLAGISVLSLLAAGFTFPTSAPTVATLLGLGVAIDYGLFLVARHREQLDHGVDIYHSVAQSNSKSGGAIVVAGSTVIIAILGLYVAGVPFISALGVSAAIVVAVTMVSALTLVPALLGLAKNSVRSMRRAPAPADDEETADVAALADAKHERSAFARWGRFVSDRPWPWAIGTAALLIIITIPLFFINFGQLDAGTDPTTDTDRRAYDLISEGFGPGANGPLTIVLAVPAGTSSSNTQTLLTGTQSTLAKTADVASASPGQLNKAGNTAIFTVIPKSSPQDAATTTLINDLRDNVLPTIKATTYVTGTTAGYADFTARTVQRLPWLIAAVVLLSLLLLTAAFRSLAIGIKAAVMNLLSVGAAYGVVVAVFQWGWGSSLFGLDEKVPIPAFVPMLMFAIVFGLSMDYEVFLLSRVHETYAKIGDAHRSVAIGIGGTARVITTAAAVMIVVFISFVANPDPTIKMLAVGMAVSVLIDASLVRMILVPAVMTLLDENAWWVPKWLDRILPHIDIEGEDEDAELPEPEPAAS